MKWRRRRIIIIKKEATEFQYTALPATVNESWKSTSSPHSPPSPPTLVNEDVIQELNAFMGTF
jgi:hypothetical protein